MGKKFEYTTLAHRYTSRYPLLTYVGTQVNFWIIANILLATILHFHSKIVAQSFAIPIATRIGPSLLTATILGLLYGVSLGLLGYYLDRRLLRRFSLGTVILIKAFGALTLLVLLVRLLRFVFFTLPSQYLGGMVLNMSSWESLFFLLLTYYFFMTLVISFINQVNKKYGPGVLLPLLLGRYQYPKEEERIFMFMDLKSSTSTAEKLGHLRYSSFIRDCFFDINGVLYSFYAQVYQYVGDEIVVMWPESEGLEDHRCIRFYFACQQQFNARADYYLKNYGLLPDFKAGMHNGKVTVVEIGEVKKDIAYHGDTLNTAARIQSVCNQYNRNFLISDHLLDKIGPSSLMKTEHIGMILLRGKMTEVGIVSVDWPEEKVEVI